MAYPMTYRRVIFRNGLDPSGTRWETDPDNPRHHIRDDLRRLERDQRDATHLAAYAQRAGVTPEQVKIILDAFFEAEDTCHG